jgi:hypothetical protein
VVTDKDDNETESFELVQKQIAKALGFPVPTAERIAAKSVGFPSIVVLMVPLEENGNLETLCLYAAEDKWHLSTALNAFVAETPTKDWGLSKQSKMKLQTTLAATCKGCPDTSFANHWFQNAKYRLPLDHACFDSLVAFLNDFSNLIA